MGRCGRIFLILVLLAGLLASVGATYAMASPSGAAGTFTLSAELSVRYPLTTCPPGTPSGIECYARTGSEAVRGLGNMTETYPYFIDPAPAGCGGDEVRVLPATVRLGVAGKGEIELRLSGSGCLARVLGNPVQGVETFTVTGGSSRYAGASGGGTISHVSTGPPGYSGNDTWSGTLVVPGYEFDLTAPVLTGARNKTVRARRGKKRVRVKYIVSARDAVDGARRAACQPKSGSWFRVGRTRVRCSAADTSGNESKATFIVVVKRAR